MSSTLSVCGYLRIGSSLSVLDCTPLGSSVALRGFSRMASTLSIFGCANVGSSLSLLSVGYLGRSISLRSFMRVGSALSVHSYGRVGAVSVLDFFQLGSTLALRAVGRLGSYFSVRGFSTLGSTVSLVEFLPLGATLSLRSFARLGSTCSLFGNLQVGGDLNFYAPNSAIYARDSSGALTRRIMFPEASSGLQGLLHGIWAADTTFATSDRRLKSHITPLHQRLISQMPPDGRNSAGPRETKSAAIDWVLRELRPVSFSFRTADDTKSMDQRFGFVAQEVERVLPDIVHDTGQNKALLYQDLIAMITLAAQDQQLRLERNNADVSTLRNMVTKLTEKIGHLQRRVVSVFGSLEQ